jgi:thiol-disulfide isomerase/thioredoxin/mono/diheme cytochrome c family protein
MVQAIQRRTASSGTSARPLQPSVWRLRSGAALLVAVAGSVAMAQSPVTPDPLQRTTLIEDGASRGVGRLVPDLKLVGLGSSVPGGPQAPAQTLAGVLASKRLVVVTMTSVTCPISKKLAPRLAKLEDEWREKGVAFIYVNTVEAESESDMRRQAREQGWEGPYLADRDRSVSGALDARTTTEVFVIDASRTLLYRGAVDDQYGIGTSLPEPRQHFLRDAIEAALEGQKLRVRSTFPPGCLLDREVAKPAQGKGAPAIPAEPPLTNDLTYHGRISRILAQNCVSCHQNGGEAPFALASLADVQGRVRMIEAVVGERIMPPTHGAPATGAPPLDNASAGARWMNDEDRADLLEWLASDRAVGNASDAIKPSAAEPSGNWRIGSPEVVLFGAPMALPAEGPMVHHRVLIPTNASADLLVNAIEVRPVERGTIHHALLWIVPPGGRLPEPGAVPTDLELLTNYSPGDSVLRLASGRARRVPLGSLIVADVYLRPMGREMNAGLRIGMRTQAAAPKTLLTTRTLVAAPLAIAAGAKDVEASAEMLLDRAVRVTALTPSAAARCTSLRVEAILPDGTARVLLDAPRFDFRWQLRSAFAEPIDLPVGTRLRLSGRFDNSASNTRSPDPRADARDGSRAGDERLLVSVEFE